MVENDSSPLDGQQEKTRAYHTPVVRQQEVRNSHLAARISEKPQNCPRLIPIFCDALFCGIVRMGSAADLLPLFFVLGAATRRST
jgi:hypothetical protein